MAQPHWRDGGAVNAIEKMQSCWTRSASCARSGAGAPTSGTPTSRRATSCRPSSAAASGWSPTRPAARFTCELMYLPGERRRRGLGHAGRARGDRVDPATLRRRPVAGRAPAADRVEPRHPAGRGRSGAPARDRHARCQRRRRRAVTHLRARLLVRRRHLHALRRHALHRLRARATSPGRTRSTSTCRSTTWCAAHRGWQSRRSATVSDG